MGKKKKEKKFTIQAAALSAAGIAGTVLWQKKDLLRAMLQLRQYPDGWVLIQKEPEVFLTRTTKACKENLFAYLEKSPWRLVDQVADGFFWMNQQEEILLLTQKKIWGDYWSWTASRPFFSECETCQPVEHTVPDDLAMEMDSFNNDMTEKTAGETVEAEEVVEHEDVETVEETVRAVEAEPTSTQEKEQ